MVNDDFFYSVSFAIRNMIGSSIIIIIAIFLMMPVSLSCQSIEITGGINTNRYFDYGSKDSHIWSEYERGEGFSVSISLNDVPTEMSKMRFTLGFESYEGKSKSGYHGLGGSNSMTVNVRKTVLSTAIYPLLINIKNKLVLDLGLETSLMINESIKGISYSRLGNDFSENSIEDEYDRLSSRFNLGLKARVGYDYIWTENLTISPHYSFYLGITDEFETRNVKTKSMRHFIGIGVERKLVENIER